MAARVDRGTTGGYGRICARGNRGDTHKIEKVREMSKAAERIPFVGTKLVEIPRQIFEAFSKIHQGNEVEFDGRVGHLLSEPIKTSPQKYVLVVLWERGKKSPTPVLPPDADYTDLENAPSKMTDMDLAGVELLTLHRFEKKSFKLHMTIHVDRKQGDHVILEDPDEDCNPLMQELLKLHKKFRDKVLLAA